MNRHISVQINVNKNKTGYLVQKHFLDPQAHRHTQTDQQQKSPSTSTRPHHMTILNDANKEANKEINSGLKYTKTKRKRNYWQPYNYDYRHISS